MKKSILLFIALSFMSFAMAQSSNEVSTVEKNMFGGASYCFVDHGYGINFDFLAFIDFFAGYYNYNESGVKIDASTYIFSLTYPYSFDIGKSFFIAPTVGAGYYHNTTTTKILGNEEKNKSGAFDFLLSPKVGFIIPIKDCKLRIFAQYRYDAIKFKFEGKGLWGIGLGFGG